MNSSPMDYQYSSCQRRRGNGMDSSQPGGAFRQTLLSSALLTLDGKVDPRQPHSPIELKKPAAVSQDGQQRLSSSFPSHNTSPSSSPSSSVSSHNIANANLHDALHLALDLASSEETFFPRPKTTLQGGGTRHQTDRSKHH